MKYGLLILLLVPVIYLTFSNVTYTDDGIYQVNSLEYYYTSGYAMNSDVKYNIDCDDECILKVKLYGKDEDDIKTKKLSDNDMKKIVNILNKNRVLSWKGFNKFDKNVLDGDSFHFYLRYNDDEKLSASGYMMYPDHYKNFKEELEGLFNENYLKGNS